MKKLKVYLDTSIINFVTADDAPVYRDITLEFFNNYFEDYDIFISEIVYLELNKTTDKNRKNILLNTLKEYNLKIYDELNNEIEDMAKDYIENKLIPQKKYEDALHIAYSTYYEFDILLSWNFKHLANIKKEIEINSFNNLNGYEKKLNLTNPMELIYEK